MSILGAAVMVGMVTVLCPEGEGGGIKRHVGFVGALCILCILVSPTAELAKVIEELSLDELVATEKQYDREYYGEYYSDYLTRLGEQSGSDTLKELLCRRFDIAEGQCAVRLTVSEGKATDVTVILSGRALLRDPYEIEEYVEGLMSCPCKVVG